MGVYIKGIKMPENCCDCPCYQDAYDYYPYCMAIEEQRIVGGGHLEKDGKGRHKDCPLVEVPEPHGDLIDREILEQELRNGIKAGNLEEGYEHYANINSMDDCVECVRYADTVIEAEGE